MPNAIATSLERAAESAVALLWRQWSTLGVGAGRPARTVIDPEALLLASSWFARDEVRLTSAAESWRRRSHALVSEQRLRNLTARTIDLLPAVPPSVSPGAASGRATEQVPLTRRPATLLLQLRLLMSVGAKADILALLLGRVHDESLPFSCLVEECSYGPNAIRKATRDLAWSGVLASSREGRQGLRDTGLWWPLLGRDQPDRSVWQSWWKILARLAVGRRVVERSIEQDVTTYGLTAEVERRWDAIGEPLPWMTALPTIPRDIVPGSMRIEAWCEEIAQLMRDDG